jgi:diguanylate cyclase (GGDEF)-like protein
LSVVFADRNPQEYAGITRFEPIFTMNRSIQAFRVIPLAFVALAAALGCAQAVWSAPSAPLTSLHAIHALTNAEASHAIPVAFEATVTYFNSSSMNLTVQDDDVAIYVYATLNVALVPGDRVLVRGTTQDSFRPIVISNDVTLISHAALPKPIHASFDEMIRGERDCMFVTLQGVVRAADLVTFARGRITDLQILVDGGYVEALVSSTDAGALKNLLDAEVEVTGVVSGRFDGKKQLTGTALYVSKLADVKILKPASADFESLSVTPMDQILGGYHVRDFTSRVRVHGTITYYQPGSAMVLENGTKSLWITTQTDQPMRIGDLADASGFPDASGGFITLTRGEILDSHVQAPIAAHPVTWSELSSGWNGFDLVSTEGRVLMAVREATQDEYVLVSDGHLFSAVYRHPNGMNTSQLPPMKAIQVDSRIRVSGICMLFNSDPFNGPMAFDLLLRSNDDIVVVAQPSWRSVRNLTIAIGLLFVVVLTVGARSWAFERSVRRESATAAYIERRRGRILEDINGSRPLAEIIEQITELVSFQLKGAPCWCQVTDGALLGNCPGDLKAMRILHHKIPARSGLPLGELSAAFDPLANPHSIEPETLSMAAELATLAIETRRLYSDLLRRSEFDLLTDIRNRFSFDKRLDAQIEEARLHAGIFGLIYVDLDEFKQVNDHYGHLVGDFYLQEIAVRMKRQLRPGDTLARLGGDEFAALLPSVRSRADVEEVARRLERCFDEPFAVQGVVHAGSASVGVALYPEDGATKDSLLSTADAAMYVRKHTRHSRKDSVGNNEAGQTENKSE